MKHSSDRSALHRSLILVSLVAALLLSASTWAASTRMGAAAFSAPCSAGDISVDTIWASSCAVTTPITVKSGATLTIRPGVEILFNAGTWLRVEGGLVAQGTQAQQVRLLGSAGATWVGVIAARPSRGVSLRSVTLANAQTGVALLPPGAAGAAPPSSVNITDSLFLSNTVAISDSDSGVRLSLSNNLITRNGTGLLVQNPGSGQSALRLRHNSFVGNAIALKVVGQGSVKAIQQWWGPGGPVVGLPAACAGLPAPGSSSRNLICGAVVFKPASKSPAGRMILAAGAGTDLESELGPSSQSDTATTVSIATLHVPPGTFAQQVDLLVAGRLPTEMPPIQQPNLRPTPLFLEVTAVANGQEIHNFAGGRQLTLTIHYVPSDLGGANPARLLLYYWDESLHAWSFQGFISAPDPAHQQVVVKLQHLSRMVIMDASLKQVWLPLIAD